MRASLASLILVMSLVFQSSKPAQDASTQSRCGGKESGSFPIVLQKKWGLINGAGKVILVPQFSMIRPFSDGFANVYLEDGRPGFLDSTGLLVLRLDVDTAREFSEGLSAVRIGKKWGFINKTGKIAVSPEFDFVSSFRDGLAAVKSGKNWKYIDKTGSTVVVLGAGDHESLFPFSDGLAIHFSPTQGFGYIDKKGKWAIQPAFELASDFRDGLAAVQRAGLWGYIDNVGKVQVPLTYSRAEPFSEGLAAVRTSSKMGFIDKKGVMVIPARFDDAGPFCGGLAPVQFSGKWGFIDKSGSVTIAPQFEEVLDASGGLAEVVLQDLHGARHLAYVDEKGKIVWVSPESLPNVEY